MERNEIRKVLYKENPTAHFIKIRKGFAYYLTILSDMTKVEFEVPISDMGDADFTAEMESKFLQRYIVEQ